MKCLFVAKSRNRHINNFGDKRSFFSRTDNEFGISAKIVVSKIIFKDVERSQLNGGMIFC
jgi:hypothetical protein